MRGGWALLLWSIVAPPVGAAQDSVPPPTAPPARRAIKVKTVKFEFLEARDFEPQSGLLRFTVFGDTSRPHSQIYVQLSRPPDDDEDEVELNVWLLDAKTRDTVKVGPDATLEPWVPSSTAREEAWRDVEWLSLRPTSWDSLPGQKSGVFVMLVVAAASPKVRVLSPKFVLVDGDRP